MTKYARLDAFARGQIVALAKAGWRAARIRRTVRKPNGRRATVQAVRRTIRKAARDPQWRGGRVPAGGRPRDMADADAQALVDLVFRERGTAVVTIKYCQRRLRRLRRYCRWVI